MTALRKPTATLEASGAFLKNPNRKRDAEPNTGRGIGPAPAHLDDLQRAAWDEVVSSCAAGVFQSSDRPMMEVLSVHLAEFRKDPAGFGFKRTQVLVQLLARCGMTPSDRSKVTAGRAEDEKPKAVRGLDSFRR